MYKTLNFVILSVSEESKQSLQKTGFFAYAQNDKVSNDDHH
jgi:hypothetical protein